MAAGNFVVPAKSLMNIVSKALLAQAGGSYKIALVSSAWTPDNTASGVEKWGDISSNEISASGGYQAGGIAMSGAAISFSGNSPVFSASNVSITATGGDIPAWRRAVVYYDGTLGGVVKPIVAHCAGRLDGSNVPIDVPATISGSPLNLNFPSGILGVS